MDRDNVYAEKKEDRIMMTRLHTVVNIYFVKCGSYVGWRYARRNMCMSIYQNFLEAFVHNQDSLPDLTSNFSGKFS